MLITKLSLLIPSQDGTITTNFERTPVMSPYLLAFVVSDFTHTSYQDGPTLHRAFTRPDTKALDRTQFSLRNANLFLKELERFVSFGFELKKVDHIALPDFASGLFVFHR